MSGGFSTLKPGTVVDGRYAIEVLLGQGGMAVVYRAKHLKLGTLHALKVLKLPHQAIQDRLVTEGRVQARLRHPNIVAVSDIVEVDGSPCLVMEYIDGSSLDELLVDQRLPLEAADVLSRGIIDGVAEAHRQELIHRDLKPANIMLAVRDRKLIPKITDFGLAKLLAQGETGTRSGITMGTPAYMPPEQIRDAKSVDIRADVFATGAILYEIVTGRRAYEGADTLEVFNKICTGDRIPILELVPDLPRRMQRAIDGALRIEVEDRIPDCATLLQVWTGETRTAQEEGPFGTDLFVRVRELGSRPPGSAVDLDALDEALAKRAGGSAPGAPDPDGATEHHRGPPPSDSDTLDFHGLGDAEAGEDDDPLAKSTDIRGVDLFADAPVPASTLSMPPRARWSPLLLLPALGIVFLLVGGGLGLAAVGTGVWAGWSARDVPRPVGQPVSPVPPKPQPPDPTVDVEPPVDPPVVKPVGQPVQPPDPDPDPDPEPAPVPQPAPEPAPVPQPVTRPTVVPKPPPTPSPVRPPPRPRVTTGSVRIEGNVSVTLFKDQKAFDPGTKLPVGTYTARVSFPDGVSGDYPLTVRAGKTTTLTCNITFWECE